MSGLLKTNEHSIERVARIVLGAGLIGAAATGGLGGWGYIGAVPLLTGIIGSCPIYTARTTSRYGARTAGRSRRPRGFRRTRHAAPGACVPPGAPADAEPGGGG